MSGSLGLNSFTHISILITVLYFARLRANGLSLVSANLFLIIFPFSRINFKTIDWKPTIVEVFAGKLDYKKYKFFDRKI
jgi:hypothetical protein